MAKADFSLSTYSKETVNYWRETLEQHLDLRFNLDYRDIDEQWIKDLSDTHLGYRKTHIYDEMIERRVRTYANYLKANKVSIRGDFYVEPNITYLNWYASSYQRVWLKFEITSPVVNKVHLNESVDVYYDTNKVYEGYVDLSLSTSTNDLTGLKFGVADYDVYLVKHNEPKEGLD